MDDPTKARIPTLESLMFRRMNGGPWWSQQDSNPCLDRERKDEPEEKKQNYSSEVSDE